MAHCQPLPLWTGCMPDAEGPPQLLWGMETLLAVDKDHPTCKQQYDPGCYFQTTRLWAGIESAFPPRKKVWTGGNTTANQIDIFVPSLDIVTGLSTKLNLIRRYVLFQDQNVSRTWPFLGKFWGKLTVWRKLIQRNTPVIGISMHLILWRCFNSLVLPVLSKKAANFEVSRTARKWNTILRRALIIYSV